MDLPMADSYSHAVIMTCMQQKKKDTTNYLESLMLFYLHYFL